MLFFFAFPLSYIKHVNTTANHLFIIKIKNLMQHLAKRRIENISNKDHRLQVPSVDNTLDLSENVCLKGILMIKKCY